MDFSLVNGVDFSGYFKTPSISSGLADGKDPLIINPGEGNTAFQTAFDSALNLISEANAYSNAAEEEEIKFALGETAYMICKLHSRKLMCRSSIQLQLGMHF